MMIKIFGNRKIFSLILAIFPAFFLGLLILKYSVNYPYWDQWAIAQLFAKVEQHTLTFDDLIAQHNESRKFFPRLLFIGLGFLTHWNVKYEMLVIFLLACIVSFNIYYLSQLTVSGSTIKRLFLAAISNLLIFSPIQYENWLWGIQVVVFIPIASITTCILIAYSRLTVRAKFLICIALATVTTFSYANGLLSWIVLFPLLALKSRKELSKNKWLVFAWIAGFISNATLYFYNYHKPGHHPSFLESLKYPVRAIHYFMSFFGAPLGSGISKNSLTTSTIIGFILILLLLASYFYILKHSKDFNLLNRVGGWLTIQLYTLASGIITTSGRVGFGAEQSLSSRYTTFSVYLTVSLIYILVIVADDIQRKGYLATKKLLTKFTPFMLAIFLVMHISTAVYAIGKMSENRIDFLQRKACLAFINIVQDDCLKMVYPQTDLLKVTAKNLNRLGMLNPALVKSDRIQDITGEQKRSKQYGFFDSLTKVGDREYIASGWAILPQRKEPADSVILTYENATGNATIFAFVYMRNYYQRNDVAKALKNESFSTAGWEKYFSASKLPKGKIKIDAWAFDSNTGKAFHLNDSQALDNR